MGSIISFAAQFFISLVVSNWVYSEVLFFIPSFENFAYRVMAVVKIPTHDEWPDIKNAPEAKVLNREVKQMAHQSRFSQIFHSIGITDRSIRDRWNNMFAANSTVARPAPNRDYLTGEEIFVDQDPTGSPLVPDWVWF